MRYLFLLLFLLPCIHVHAQKLQPKTITTTEQQPNAGGVYDSPEQPAYFPYGQDSLDRYIRQHIHFDHIDKDIKGKAIVVFIVETDGSIKKAEILRTSGDARFDDEAVQVVKTISGWKPAKNKGIVVRSSSMISVGYQLK